MRVAEPSLDRIADAATLLFGPISTDEFFAQHFERSPLHITRDESSRFDALYGITDVEEALLLGAGEPDQFALVKAGQPDQASGNFTVRRPAVRWRETGKGTRVFLDPRQVTDFFESGYTVLIKDAARFSARLQRFCIALQTELDSYVQANVYCSPPSSQGFELHHDTHDTLVAQIEGEKRWLIYEPLVRLPLESQPLARGSRVEGLRLCREIVLRAGETLYVPRGYPHEAVAGAQRSLHVTFALLPLRVIDLVLALVRVAGRSDLALRQALPRNWHRDDARLTDLAAGLSSLLTSTFSAERVRLAKRTLLDEHFVLSRNEARGAFEQLRLLKSLTPASGLRLNTAIPYVLREEEAVVVLLVAGRAVTFEKRCLTALRRLEDGPTTVGDLDASLSDAERADLIATLVRQGLVMVDDLPMSR